MINTHDKLKSSSISENLNVAELLKIDLIKYKIKSSSSIDKSHIPKHFYVGNRKAQILHTTLRTNCSSLNLDLFIKNFSDSPLCQCGSVENAQHYFFHCRKYQVQRTKLMNIVSQYQTPSLSILLYGNNSLSYEINTIIFEKVHRFILDSKLF